MAGATRKGRLKWKNRLSANKGRKPCKSMQRTKFRKSSK